ncbi:hypothetical protein INS49_005117 [Diaporthe citri]|uniref:uncharacterized protein n=1 Tax=Diaporthe citri TaxID=83186 RepID=UPI001C7F9418|nr:uncharacterized protein INS49_005117 [Diaporthe citri]KAG6353860.1 hypothetical protein INS49_005117 [Diaporthe citri]
MDALAAKAHVGKMIDILEGDMTWGTMGTPQKVATAVISEVNGSYERPQWPKISLEAVQNMLPLYRFWAEPLVRQAVRHYWILKSVSRGVW